jgi:hypothetical protein
MVSFGSQMQAAASIWIIVVQIRPLIFKKHVNNSWMTIPAGDFKRNPLIHSLHVWINIFFEYQIIYNTLVSNCACNMQWVIHVISTKI